MFAPFIRQVGLEPLTEYDATGGVDSERTFVKQIVQKFCDDGSTDDLFNEEEMEKAEESTK